MNLEAPSASRFAPGQRWQYRTRAGEESSTLLVVKVDGNPKLGNIVHISVSGLRIRNARAPNGFSENASHLPFAEKAIEQSVTRQVGTEDVGDAWRDGYSIWEKDFRGGKAGVFTTPVSEALGILGEVLEKN